MYQTWEDERGKKINEWSTYVLDFAENSKTKTVRTDTHPYQDAEDLRGHIILGRMARRAFAKREWHGLVERKQLNLLP